MPNVETARRVSWPLARLSRRVEKKPRYDFEEMSKDDVDEAIALANAVFPSDVSPETGPEFSYRAELDPEKYRDALERAGIHSLEHWSLKDRERKIIGLTGIYRLAADPPQRLLA